MRAAFSPTLARILRDVHTRARTDLERVFADELGALADPGRTNTLAALEIVTGPDAWETLRERHEFTADRARQCVTDSVVRQLQAVRG